MNTQIIKPLGKITALLADLGLEVTYAYDDLVFVQECAFLLQFTDDPVQLNLFTNTECHPDEANSVAAEIVLEFDGAGFCVTPAGRYSLAEGPESTIELQFL
ncbi:hypothetical protein [Pontiella sulfatireligans]|uniref:Uncharacterized protein n=1 Tax=Pontiella sulfatireligans TaxID=2750658 RepID=A0A6C2UQ43_9BACT|nr:hypothetical protein [Pontiella sulfatireligans]VGO22410.1 hypothetical protein SCARR_04493 [Pontiella sulfatireligans]